MRLYTTHGKCQTRSYRIWAGIKTRCLNPRSRGFAEYGGNGIGICDRWLDFRNFYADMGDPPTVQHSIERQNGSLGYSPDNCKWATPQEQANNRKSSRVVEYNGQSLTIAQWADSLGISQKTISTRLNRNWTVGQALEKEAR
jgi:hypothetical protein